MKFELKSARPSTATLGFLLIMSIIIGYSITVYSGLISYLFVVGLLLVLFTLLYNVYGFLFGRYPLYINIGQDSLEIIYEDGKGDKLTYSSISSVYDIPNPSKDSAHMTIIFRDKGIRKTKAISIIGKDHAKRIVEEIKKHIEVKQ